CTHYRFVIPQIKQIVGEGVRVIDPAPAIARQVGRLLDAHALHTQNPTPGLPRFLTTGSPAKFQDFLENIGLDGTAEYVQWGMDL
ncbi:MAG TPA: glutamate racemase, partial [Anaerolineales bacterium]|nr:glutamate racemase [Anaerolineales bacterium]